LRGAARLWHSSRVIFTVGHSTRPLAEFLALLTENGVSLLADVRTVPRSRTNPQFNATSLPEALAAACIGYRHLAALGGLRKRHPGTSPNGAWRNESFRNYADYALTPEFRAGLDALRALARTDTVAIMCAEAVWWRCHRRIIADYLLAAGEAVTHIMGPGKTEPARPTRVSVATPEGSVLYPG
jgi:uncharacterized protein (DUF488 family)